MKKNLTDSSFQGFFTDAVDLSDTMVSLLGDVSGQDIIEPCFGEGAFIKKLMGKPNRIDAIDIDEEHFKTDLKVENCNYYHADFIDYFVSPELRKNVFINSKYDSAICNPPYGLKFSKEYRSLIKKAYPNIYAKESYAIFFYLTIQQLKNNGRYVFIVPDSFLTSTNLTYMRDFIVSTAKPTHIIQFKSKRFGSVNFAYSNMCIIAGNKVPIEKDSTVKWIDAVLSDEPLVDLLSSDKTTINGEYLINNAKDAWISPKVSESVEFSRDFIILDDIAECKTGIYTGDNQRFCGFNVQLPPRRLNGHPVDWSSVTDEPSKEEKDIGIRKEIAYVPFIRGGHRDAFEKTNSCIRWDIEAVEYYDKDKKARLQNKGFYFKKGLAIPMVTSGRLSASEMDNSIFDQGVVGVFAKNENYHNFLLIYLNDSFATKVKSLVSPGANNSANYLKRIKVPKLTDLELREATEIVCMAKNIGWNETKSMRDSFIKKVI